MSRWFVRIRVPVAFLVVGILGTGIYLIPDILRIGTAHLAHTLCSEVFIGGRNADRTWQEFIRPVWLYRSLESLVSYKVDAAEGSASAWFMGGFRGTAVARNQAGCLMDFSGEVSEKQNNVLPTQLSTDTEVAPGHPALFEIAGPALVKSDNQAVSKTIDGLFEEIPGKSEFRTRAVVVLHKGRVIAERYADGTGINTRLNGFSITKSFKAALIGILEQQGKLKADQPAAIQEWSKPGDGRAAITLEHLLRMTSGLRWTEDLAGASPDTGARMLYLEPNMSAFAISKPLANKPGTVWQYNSGNTSILGKIIMDSTGGTSQSVSLFAQKELFEPLGMRHVIMTRDYTGAPAGGSNIYASARDWARFGQLFLNDGKAGTRQILPPKWGEFCATPKNDAWTGYGAGFWTNRGDSLGAKRRKAWGMPADSYFASGHLGQMIVIVPSADIVFVRMGVSHNGMETFERISGAVGAITSIVSKL